MVRKIRNYLFKGDHWVSRFLNRIIISLIIFSISIIPLYFLYAQEKEVFEGLLFIEKTVVTIFILEFALRIILAKKPKRYILSKWGVINFLSIIPLFLYNLNIFETFPVYLLLFRFLRLWEFVKFPRLEEMESREMKQYEHFTILKDEKLLRIVQKHALVFLSGLILPLFLTSGGVTIMFFFEFHIIGVIIGSLFLILAIVFYIKTWLDFRYDVLFITDTRIIVQERELFGTVSDKINYESISVIVPDTQGFFKMIFGYGHLSIKTPSDSTEVRFTFVPNINEIAHIISQNRDEIMKRNQYQFMSKTI